MSNGETVFTEEANKKRLAEGRCCWHCQFYRRPTGMTMVDGPVGYVCTVNRDLSTYALNDVLNPGEKHTLPDDYCGKFELEPPPEPHSSND